MKKTIVLTALSLSLLTVSTQTAAEIPKDAVELWDNNYIFADATELLDGGVVSIWRGNARHSPEKEKIFHGKSSKKRTLFYCGKGEIQTTYYVIYEETNFDGKVVANFDRHGKRLPVIPDTAFYDLYQILCRTASPLK